MRNGSWGGRFRQLKVVTFSSYWEEKNKRETICWIPSPAPASLWEGAEVRANPRLPGQQIVNREALQALRLLQSGSSDPVEESERSIVLSRPIWAYALAGKMDPKVAQEAKIKLPDLKADRENGPIPLLTSVEKPKGTWFGSFRGKRVRVPLHMSGSKIIYLFIGPKESDGVPQRAGFFYSDAIGCWITDRATVAAALGACADRRTKARLVRAGVAPALFPYLRFAPILLPMRQEFRIASASQIDHDDQTTYLIPPPMSKKQKANGFRDVWEGGNGKPIFRTRSEEMALEMAHIAPKPLQEVLRRSEGTALLKRRQNPESLSGLKPRSEELENIRSELNMPGSKAASGASLKDTQDPKLDACQSCDAITIETLGTVDKGQSKWQHEICQEGCGKLVLQAPLDVLARNSCTKRAWRRQAYQQAWKIFRKEQESKGPLYPAGVDHNDLIPKDCSYRPKQLEAVEHCAGLKTSLDADVMGAGKTFTALTVRNHDLICRNRGRPTAALFICPAQVRLKWVSEAKRFTKGFHPGTSKVVQLDSKSRLSQRSKGVFIASYETVRDNPSLADLEWDLVVADESHYGKNTRAKRTRALKRLQAKRFMFMTGTPVYNRPTDLHPLLDHAFPKAFRPEKGFRKAFDIKDPKKITQDEQDMLSEVKNFLNQTIMIRRGREEMLADLPKRPRPELVRVPLKDAEAIAQREKELIEERKRIAEQGGPGIQVLAQIAKLRELVSIEKVPHAVRFVQERIQPEPFILFSYHRKTAEMLLRDLRSIGIRTGLIHGEIPHAERSQVCAAFEKGRLDAVCATMSSAGLGIDLIRAQHVIFIEIDWSPASIDQAEARAIRPGQTKAVRTWFVVADGTMDALVGHQLTAKRGNAMAALGDEEEEYEEEN